MPFHSSTASEQDSQLHNSSMLDLSGGLSRGTLIRDFKIFRTFGAWTLQEIEITEQVSASQCPVQHRARQVAGILDAIECVVQRMLVCRTYIVSKVWRSDVQPVPSSRLQNCVTCLSWYKITFSTRGMFHTPTGRELACESR